MRARNKLCQPLRADDRRIFHRPARYRAGNRANVYHNADRKPRAGDKTRTPAYKVPNRRRSRIPVASKTAFRIGDDHDRPGCARRSCSQCALHSRWALPLTAPSKTRAPRCNLTIQIRITVCPTWATGLCRVAKIALRL